MDETEQSKQSTPLGNERRDNPGQTNIMMNSDGTDTTPSAPQWDENTPLDDIVNQHTGIGDKYNDLVENAADNVGDRQVQLIGNDFGATNPYMFNTYYEPAATSFASKMRVQGTEEALNEGLTRAEKEAQNNLAAAKQRYNNALAAQKAREEAARNANAYVSETDVSKLPQSTAEKEFIASEEFQHLSEEERQNRLTSIRTKDMQDTLEAAGDHINWDIKADRKVATDRTLAKFGLTRDQLNAMSQAEKDAFWGRTDVGNYWTEQYMLNYFDKHYSADRAAAMQESFNDIHNDVNAIVDAINNNKVDDLDIQTFKTAVPVSLNTYTVDSMRKSIEESDVGDDIKTRMYEILDQYSSDQDRAWLEQAVNALAQDKIALNEQTKTISKLAEDDDGDWWKKLMGNPAVTTFGVVVGAPAANKKTYEDFAKAEDLLACFEGDRGEAATVNAISETLNLGTPERTNPDWYGKVEYRPQEYQWYNDVPTSTAQQEELVDYVKNDAFTAAFGVDWDSIRDIAEMKAERPDDYNYLLNQVSFILSDNPVEIVEDENKEYFINGEYKKLSKGDLVFHTIDGMVDKDGKFRDSDLQHYVDLYKDIYNGKEPASEENLKALQKYFGEYQARTQAAMAASARFGVKVDEDIYGSIILMMSDQESNTGDKLLFNPNDPNGDKISLNEFRTWFGNLKEDEQYNFYTAIANRARQTTGHYYIYDEKIGGMKDILGGKSNGEDVIGKRNKKEGDSNMWAADKVKDFSDEQCLAMNMILDDQMRRGSIKTSFFDNDEVGLYTRYTNKFFYALNGSVDFYRWAGLSLIGNVADIFVDDKDNWFYKSAGAIWDDMTTLGADDDDKFFKDKDMVLGNNYTMEVRAQQRANLNHLIDTTFNIEYFNPDNEYDPATGQVKDKDGNVISYTDGNYFHADKMKAGLDVTADMVAYITEFILECWGSGEISKLGTKLGTSIVSKSVAAKKLINILTANATITGVKSAMRANKDLSAAAKIVKEATKKGAKVSVKNAKYGKAILNVANKSGQTEAAGKAVGAALGGNSIVDDAIRAGGRTAASEADNVISAINNANRGAAEAEKGASITDDLIRSGDSLADDLAKTTGKVTDNIVDGMYEGEMKLTAAGIDMPAEGIQQQMVRNYAMDTLIESADASTVDTANKLASYLEKALTKTGNVLDKISPFKGTVEGLRSMLSNSALNMLQRSAMNVRVAEAAGVSVEQVSKLSDNAISVLYNALRVSEGKAMTDIGAYVGRYINKAGKATAAGGLDFSQAVRNAVSQSEALAAAGSKAGLSADDTIRILANSSKDKNALLSALQFDRMLKERVTDWAQDIKMNYYTPYLDNEFNSDYTDIEEYFTDPTQWLSGAVFDLGATGLRRLGNSVSLSLTNQKINKLLGKIDVSPSSAVDKAKLNRDLVKLNRARMKADKLTNKILDGSISVNKVTEAKDRATRTLDEYMNQITDGFDYAKGMDQMASIMDTAMAERNTWDKVQEFFTTSKGTPLLGRSRTMQAMDLNRYLLKSNDSLNAFYMLAQAEQSSAIINFADIKAHTDNLRKISGKQWAIISADGFQKSLLKKTSDMFDGLNGNTINISDKTKAKAMLQEGQTVLYDAIYDSAYEKLHDKAGAAIDWPAFRSELNWVRDRMVEMGSKQIDMGNSVRWNYFPTQGIMFDMDPDTPIALAGFYYGSGLHPDVSNQMANPFDTRDTWDMATISDNVLNGKESYTQPLGKKEMIKNEKLGITGTTKEIPYNMDFFNPAYALTAYQNAFNSKQFAAKMFDPMQNGHVVVRDDSALDFATGKTNMELEGAAAAREAQLKKEYIDAYKPKTYRNAKRLTQDIDALQTKAKRGITDVQKNIKNVSSRDINAQNTKLRQQTAKAEQMVAKSDLFKGYRDYAGLKGKSNKTVTAHMMENYNLVVSDVAAARKALKGGSGVAEGVSDAYKSNTLYRNNVDALARDKNLTKDVLKNQQNILIGGENGVQLNANALKTPFYNTMVSLEQSKRTNAAWKEFLDALAADPALRQGQKYSLQDFVKVHDMDETDLRKNFSAKIYDIVRGRYGAVDGYTGSLKLNETFSKSLNQAIYDAYDEVALRKAAGEGVSLVEVLEELNEKFPGMEVVGDDRYWNLLTNMSKYANGGGDPTTLQASIGAELNKMSQDGNLNSEDAKTLVQMASLISDVSDNSSRLSGIAGSTGATKDIDEALESGDERMLADVDADPERQSIAREDAAKEAAEIEAGRAGKEQQVADVKSLISKYGDVFDLSDRQRMEILANGMDILARNASGRSDIATRTDFNTQAFKTFRNDIKKPYQEIAEEIEAKLTKKGVKLSKADNSKLNPPERGLFEGMSDAQYLKIQRELERGQTVRIKGSNYTKDSVAIERAKDIGQDGRGIVSYYNPKDLQQLVDQHGIKLSKKNAEALKKLTDRTSEFALGGGSSAVGYAEFAKAMTGTEYRYTPKDDIVNLRTAVENDIASHKTDATRLLRTSETGLGIVAPKEGRFWNNGPTIKMLDANDDAISISLITDTGTLGASEAAQQFDRTTSDAVGYHLEVTKADGSVESFADFDDLANSQIFKSKDSKAPSTSASELEDAFRESGYTIPEASYGEAQTNHFGRMDADEIEERRINDYIDRRRAEAASRKKPSRNNVEWTGKSGAENTSAADARTKKELKEWKAAQKKRFSQYDNAPEEVLTPQAYLRKGASNPSTDNAAAQAGTKAQNASDVDLKDYMSFELNRHTKKPRYNEKTISALADKYSDAVAKAQTPEEIAKVADDIATDLVPIDPDVEGASTELQHVTADVQNAIFWLKQGTSETPSQSAQTAATAQPAQTGAPDIRNPESWSIESIMSTNQATDAARSKYASEYNRYQKLVDATKNYTANNSALSFAGETTGYKMSIAEQNLNNFLYGDTNGATGHFDKVAEISDRINRLQSETEKLFDKKISDSLSALKKLNGTSYEDIVETLEAAKKEAMEAYKETPAVQKQIAKRFDEEIDFVKQKLGKTKLDAQKFADHDPELKALKEASASHKAVTAGEGQVKVHNIGGMLIVGKDATVQNRISLADLREANEVVDIKTGKTHNPIESVSRARSDKKVLKDMRKSFNDGWDIKGKVSDNTSRQQNAWIDNIVEEIKDRTGNPDIDEANIYVDKQLANLGQFYFREGRQGWQEKAYKAMSAISSLNKQIQDFHLAGGVGQFNAFTLRNAITMMWQDPVGGTRALFTNFNNAKSNTSVMKFFIDNHERLLKYAVDSGDFSVINSFAPVISMDERLVGGGVIDGVINQIYGAKNTFATALEREGKRSAVLSVPKGIYNEIFSNPTFARWTIIAKADMQMRNYAKAQKFVTRIASRYNLSDEDFAKADNGMWGSKDQYIATLARLRTDRYWNPADFAKTGFSTKKYLKRKEKGDMKTTAESLKGIQAERSMADCASDFFFAINYKLQMNAHPINGFGSMVASVLTVPRASLMARSGNLAPMAMRFAGRGDRTQAAVMIGIAALAHWWNTSIGAPSAWEELWGDHGNKDNGTYGMAQSLLNFQDFGKFWIPNNGNGGVDLNKEVNSVDPFFSIFTLQNTGARALNKAMNPNQIPINWQRTVSTEPTSLATRIAGVADELIGANLLAGYKAIYEVCMNSTYFGNNIWERKYLPDGTVNKNYNPVRNVIASMAHILNLDAVLEGKGFTENGSNRWVKGLTIEGGRGLIVGDPGVRQDKSGTVSGSGVFQHEYASALGAAARGEYFDGLTEAMELPFKSRNFASRAKTALNQEVMLAMRNELHKYEKAIKDASTEEKDKAYAEFANAAVNIMHDWSAKYGNVLGQNDELTSTATKVMISFLSDEYNDQTAYVQNVYDHLRQELKMADGDEFMFSKAKYEEAIAAGMDPEEAAAMYNKHLTALKEAQIAEYNARKALLDAGINIDPDENIFDTSDIIHADREAKKATINKKLLTEVKGKLDSKIGEFSSYKEMKAYYEDLIDNASTTKQKVKIAKEYNQMVEDIIAPYLEEYGESILNSAYWDGDYVSNHLGKYLIIPADTQYRGKTPYSNFLKDEFGVGYRDNKNLPSDKEIKEAIQKANQALAQGRMASTRAIVDNALVQSRRGTIHASDEDYEKLLRLRAMLSSRSN